MVKNLITQWKTKDVYKTTNSADEAGSVIFSQCLVKSELRDLTGPGSAASWYGLWPRHWEII